MAIKISAFLVVKAELGLVLWFSMYWEEKKPKLNLKIQAHPHSITQLQALTPYSPLLPQPWPSA